MQERTEASTRSCAPSNGVAKHLGNSPAVCRRCYIHPTIFDGFLDGTLLATLAQKTRAYLVEQIEGMSPEESRSDRVSAASPRGTR
jgi:DNA topoisomerase IB